MTTTMTHEEFIERASTYAHRLLKGICRSPVRIAVQQAPRAIRLVARLEADDFEAIKYSDLYLCVQKVVIQMGAIRRDVQGQPFNVEFKLFDPYFEGLQYEEVEDPDLWSG
jgi:hypothetical protein